MPEHPAIRMTALGTAFKPRRLAVGCFYVCDGSVITANVGSAPTLTITALAERCMATIPPHTA